MNWTWIQDSVSQANSVLDSLEDTKILAWDLETTGLDFNRTEVHGIALADAENSWYISHSAYQGIKHRLGTFLNKQDVEYRLWNAIFDLHYFKMVDAPRIFDGMIAQWLVDENVGRGLKAQATIRGFVKGDLQLLRIY